MDHLLVSDGEFMPRAGLDVAACHRAEETIRIFNLNEPALVWQRHRNSIGYRDHHKSILELANAFPEAEWYPLLEAELAQVANLPFVSAIRQVLWPR